METCTRPENPGSIPARAQVAVMICRMTQEAHSGNLTISTETKKPGSITSIHENFLMLPDNPE